MIDCSPSALMSAARCFQCLRGMQWAVRTSLLCQWSNGLCDPDAQTFIDAAGITDAGQISAICQLVADLKNGGGATSYWDRDILIYPFVGGTAASHAVNLKSPGTNDLTYFGAPAPSHGPLGMAGNVAGQAYASTGYLVTAAQQDSIRTMTYIDQDTLIHAEYYFGTASTIAPLARFYFRNDTVSPPIFYTVNETLGNAPGPPTASQIGAKFTQRKIIAGNSTIQFGTDSDPWNSVAQPSTGIPTRYLTLLAYNNGGAVPIGATSSWTSARISGFSLGATLNDAERLEYKTIWDTFEAALGRGHP